jgi:hypothetical protein
MGMREQLFNDSFQFAQGRRFLQSGACVSVTEGGPLLDTNRSTVLVFVPES